jgi:hypothetical protein
MAATSSRTEHEKIDEFEDDDFEEFTAEGELARLKSVDYYAQCKRTAKYITKLNFQIGTPRTKIQRT